MISIKIYKIMPALILICLLTSAVFPQDTPKIIKPVPDVTAAEGAKPGGQKIIISLTVTDPVADVGKIITGTFKATGTENPIKIKFKNQSPDVVSIEGGNEQTIVTSGGQENVYNFKIKALSGPKRYTISYSWRIYKLELETKENIWEKINLIQKPSMKIKKSNGS